MRFRMPEVVVVGRNSSRASWFNSSHDASGSVQIPLDLQVLGVEFSSLTNRPQAVCYVCQTN